MKQRKGIIRTILALVLAITILPVIPAAHVHAEEEMKAISNIRLSVGDGQTVPQYQAGEAVTLTLNLTNQGNAPAKNVRISPVINNANDWPFDLKNLNEEQIIEEIAAAGTEGSSAEVKWDWTVKADVETKAYKLLFHIYYQDDTNEYDVERQVYVKTIAQKSETPDSDPEPDSTPEPEQTPGGDAGAMMGGGIYNSEPIISGGGAGNTSVPRVIVTGFSTDPGIVTAGNNFRLTVQVKNTSTVTAVSNMLFDLQAPAAGTEAAAEAPAFLPASGSSSIYLDSIPAGETREIAIDMNARADLVQKPYSIAMSMSYEDSSANQFEGKSSLAIPVQQTARFEFSDIEVAPNSIQVGEEANLTCSLYNTGRTKLYNVKVKFTGDGISAKDVFVGNVESGAAGTIDGMILGESEIAAGTKCKMIVSYEDETGKASTVEEQFELKVLPAVMDDTSMTAEPVVEEQGFPVLLIVIGAAVVAAVIVTIFLVRRKKKRARAEEEEWVDEVDRFTEDE